jgi:rhodanese-related sulfurtransferase
MGPVRTLIHAVTVAAAGVALGLAVNAASPHPAALGRPVHAAAEATAGTCLAPADAAPVARIGAAEARALCATCDVGFVDARGAFEFQRGHAVNAIHLPPVGDAVEERLAVERLAGMETVVVYDADSSCKLAEGVARRLQAAGLRDVRVLEGAWPAWVAAGGPGASGACAVCETREQRSSR